jgi:hypothetical protein
MKIINPLIKSFCGGLKNEGWKGRRVEGKKIEGFENLFAC